MTRDSCSGLNMEMRILFALLSCALLLFAPPAFAQDIPGETPLVVDFDEASGPDKALLENFEALLIDKQWTDAILALENFIGDADQRLVRAPGVSADDAFARFITLQAYCQQRLLQLARTAPKALAVYRRNVDALAERRFHEALDAHDILPLREVARRWRASSMGDQAAYTLGEWELERGGYIAARAAWESLSPLLRAPGEFAPYHSFGDSGPLWLALRGSKAPLKGETLRTALAKNQQERIGRAEADTQYDLAEIRAKLAWVSLLEHWRDRAEIEIKVLQSLHPRAEGRFGGRTVNFVEALQKESMESRQWPPLRQDTTSWPTFAGAHSRERAWKIAPEEISPLPIWERPLEQVDVENEMFGFGRPRVAERRERVLSYHPVVADGLVFVNDRSSIRAFRLDDGRPAWPAVGDGSGLIYQDEEFPPPVNRFRRGPSRFFGAPRFTMTIDQGRLYAKMGSQQTSRPTDIRRPPQASGYLVGLELRAQGRMLPGFPLRLEPDWAFEGAPIADAGSLYVALRRNGVRSQLYVASYDARSAQLRWKRKVCSAETAGQGRLPEITHALLTLHENTIYCNTNMGAVAALDQQTGGLLWAARYPRQRRLTTQSDRVDLHYFRDLTPCLLHHDMVITAPADCDRIFALEASSGQLLWATPPEGAVDAVHLLGVAQNNLLVSGEYLYWLNVYTGRIMTYFPQNGSLSFGRVRPQPHGMGRGLLAGDRVYWPTAENVFVFQAALREETLLGGRRGWRPQRIDNWRLNFHGRSVAGGNMILADGFLLMAGADKLTAWKTLLGSDAAPPVKAPPVKAP